MYQALYRKYRPKNFNEVVGQKIIVKTLKNAIENNRIAHAYIFAGPRGTGKTSIAKIFAKTINCLDMKDNSPCEKCSNCIDYNNKKSIDIIEIDAASNNGVDEIRNLKNSVNLVPSNSKYKVYIIDEVHMLSTSAFNALLKTLEEPPEFVIFILATTELYKVPETIVSRCQNFDFHRVSIENISNRLSEICSLEKIKITDEAINVISKLSNGGMRDAISLLDQLSSYKNDLIDVSDVNEVCGIISDEQMFEIINFLIEGNLKESIKGIEKYNSDGKNLLVLFEKIVELFKNLLIYMNDSDFFENKETIEMYEYYSSKIEESKLYEIIEKINDSIKNMRYESNKLLLSELLLIQMKTILQKEQLQNNSSKIEKINDENNKEQTKQNLKNKKVENKKIDKNLFEQFKSVRINNTLAQFNKKDLMEFKSKFGELKNYINDEKFGSQVSLLLDGQIKAKGNEFIIFVYSDSSMSSLFNNSIKEIESLLQEVFKTKYKVISTDNVSWEIIKKEFNENLKLGNNVYKVRKEIELVKPNEKDSVIQENDIDNVFNEIVKYE